MNKGIHYLVIITYHGTFQLNFTGTKSSQIVVGIHSGPGHWGSLHFSRGLNIDI